MMPVMDGFELLRNLKGHDTYKRIPVMMLTAKSGVQDRLNALRIGVDDYMLKPFTEDELIVRVDNLIQNHLLRVETIEATAIDSEDNPNEIGTENRSLSAVDSDLLKRIEQLMQKEIDNYNFNANDLAEQLFMSRSKLFKTIKALTGLTVREYLKEIRLQKARYILENENVGSVKEIALSVGFKHSSYFTKIYEKRFGKRPMEYLKVR